MSARILLLVAALAASTAALGAATGWPMQPMTPDLEDQPSLQRGFKLYANYCLG